MMVAFSILFWLWFVASCVVLFIGAVVVFLVTLPFDRNRRILHLYSCFWAQVYFYTNPIWSLRIEDRHKVPWHGPAVIIANHESLGDIIVLYGLYRPFKWVSKASVFSVPIIGWLMHLNQYVAIVRGKKESIAKMMTECRGWLDRGVPVLLFPEGTRSKDGVMLPFKDGAFRLSIDAKCPIIPVVLTGTADTLPKHGIILRKRMSGVVRVLDPIDPAPFGDDVARYRETVRDLMIVERDRLKAEVAAAAPKAA